MEDKNRNEEQRQEIENSSNTMVDMNPTILIIILNVSSIDTPFKNRDC